MSLFFRKGASKRENTITYLYLAFLFFGGYGIYIDFNPSHEVLEFSETYSVYLALLLSVPLLFYKGYPAKTTDFKKILSMLTVFLMIWFSSFLTIGYTVPSIVTKISGESHFEIVKIKRKNSSFKRGYSIETHSLDNREQKHNTKVSKTFYDAMKVNQTVELKGLKSDFGFMVENVSQN